MIFTNKANTFYKDYKKSIKRNIRKKRELNFYLTGASRSPSGTRSFVVYPALARKHTFCCKRPKTAKATSVVKASAQVYTGTRQRPRRLELWCHSSSRRPLALLVISPASLNFSCYVLTFVELPKSYRDVCSWGRL